MATSKSRFTVAKLDAGMAILLTSDHHLIEFPSLLLPLGVAAGSIIDLSVAQNTAKEREEHDKFIALQSDIRDLFSVHPPSTPELTVRNMTQTSVVLEWNLLDLSTAEMKSLTLYKNGSKLGKIPNATTTTTKLSGLALDTDYTFQLVLRSTAGVYKSKELKVRTHKMTNLTGLNVCISNVKTEERERVTEILARIGAKPPHEKVRIDTTHFVTNRGVGEEFKKAQNMNIPIVIPEFVEACEAEGRLMRVGSYYLDSDPALRTKRTAPAAPQAPVTSVAPSQADAAVTAPVDESTDVNSILPKQTTPLPEEADTTAPKDETSTTGLVASITNAAESVKESAQAGLEQVKSTITEASQASTVPKDSAQSPAIDAQKELVTEETVSAAAAAPAVEAIPKEQIEPHQEAAESVVDLPAQVTSTTEATEQAATPLEPVKRVASEEMEDVAL